MPGMESLAFVIGNTGGNWGLRNGQGGKDHLAYILGLPGQGHTRLTVAGTGGVDQPKFQSAQSEERIPLGTLIIDRSDLACRADQRIALDIHPANLQSALG